jgi:hypothetical protein
MKIYDKRFVCEVKAVHDIRVLPISNDDLLSSIYFLLTLRMDIIVPEKNRVYLVVVTRIMEDMVRCSSGPLEIICRTNSGDESGDEASALSHLQPGDSVAVCVTDFRFGLADEKILCLGYLVQPTILK